MRSWFPVLVIAGLGACTVGPNYRQPIMQTDSHFANAGAAGLNEKPVASRFWTVFDDPKLNQLVEEALAHNKDIDIAAANLRAARAQQRSAGFDQYPTVTAQSRFNRTRYSEHQEPQYSFDQRTENTAEAGFDAFWELDFFGRVRRENEVARARSGAAEANLHDALVTVSAEVARNYFVLRGLQDQMQVARRNADIELQTLQLTLTRLEAGRGNELDTVRADSQMQTTLATIPTLRASVATTIHRLYVLTGQAPNSLTAELSAEQPVPPLPALTSIDSPAALLRRRPDIRSAERNLAAATAQIGIAVADLFPKVTFTGSVGYNASVFGKFGAPGSVIYNVGPSITWAAFDIGRVRAGIDAANAENEAALASYQKTVLNALEETEDALVTYGQDQERRNMLEKAKSASAKAVQLARQRFEVGLVDFISVLQAEADFLNVENSLARGKTDTATSLVAIYKALGGGWMDVGAERSPSPITTGTDITSR